MKPDSIFWMFSTSFSSLLQSNNDLLIKADWVNAKWSSKSLFLKLKTSVWTLNKKKCSSLPMTYCENSWSQTACSISCLSFTIAYFLFPTAACLLSVVIWWFLLSFPACSPSSCNLCHAEWCDSLQLRIPLKKSPFSLYICILKVDVTV